MSANEMMLTLRLRSELSEANEKYRKIVDDRNKSKTK